MTKKLLVVAFFSWLLAGFATLHAQVNQIQFGKNRVQHNQFKWKFYETKNFDVFFTQNGNELAKYVLQTAEKELGGIEAFVEYSLQRKASIIIYNTYDDFMQSNVGIGTEWQAVGGLTKLVNNKIILFFDGNHANLRRKIREGLAQVLVSNLLFGDDIGEIASNQTLLDLPKWMVDGYIAYVGEAWNTDLDDQLKSAMLSGKYRTFYAMAFKQPQLAGHAFWRYIASKYGKENVSYFFYLTRVFKSLNNASLRVCKIKFKQLLLEFMENEEARYDKDLQRRKLWPKGNLVESLDVNERLDYFHFAPNPVPRSRAYVLVEMRRNKTRVVLSDNEGDVHTILKYGVDELYNERHPQYPQVAWDPKGTRVAMIYWKDGKNRLWIYDWLTGRVDEKQVLDEVEQVQSFQYMLDANTLVMSAIKEGHSDIFTYKINDQKWQRVTNDVYDDLDASFVAFPNKSGIIFSSNRPAPGAPVGDTILPHKNNYNIYLIDLINKTEFKQITKLSEMKYGNARYPTQYNTNHFTFVSDETGIGNRYAGFFSTERDGLDTLYFVGDVVLRNPENEELDSTMQVWNKAEPDSIGYVSITKDSAYTFPLTNYESSLRETRIAGDKGLVSEVTMQGSEKYFYKLKVDSAMLRKRKMNPALTEYMKKRVQEVKTLEGDATAFGNTATDTTKSFTDFFQNEFEKEQKDTAINSIALLSGPPPVEKNVLNDAKVYKYGFKFSTDYVVTGLNNAALFTRYQPYFDGITRSPIRLQGDNDLNALLRVGISDLMEDWKIYGGFAPGFNLTGNTWFFGSEYLKYRWDFGFDYFQRANESGAFFVGGINKVVPGRVLSQIYQVKVAYPFNRVKSLRVNIGYRTETIQLKNLFVDGNPPIVDPVLFALRDQQSGFLQARIEYVHDNTINPTQNIWEGLRFKIYGDFNTQIAGKADPNAQTNVYVLGFDARHYYPIYRNLTWAVRVAGDFSFGDNKFLYVLGGSDGWISPSIEAGNDPAPDDQYAFLGLAQNLRGFNQNVANGNNALVINSEVRLPVWSTFFNKPINNAFLRNFQLVQFFDLGTAWNGQYNSLKRPSIRYGSNGPLTARREAGGIGPFAGGYGFGVRSVLLGYFMKLDAAWEMNTFFGTKPIWHFSLGLDF